MDSWTLQGDSYSFLRSAPRNFSLCHRDGTPNHVEIFDIINVPSQRSVISETTCLCDIFGDDCDSPSHSSSLAVGTFVPSQREVDGTAAASPLVDDLNDSSGSYHTPQGSSEGEEGFEDSTERLNSPTLQSKSSEGRQSEGEGLSSGHPELSKDSSPNLESKSKSPVPQLSAASSSSEVLNTDCSERTPSPGQNKTYSLNPEGRVSSLSSSSVERRHSPSSPSPKQACLEAEARRITPRLKDRHNSPSHQSLTQSPSPEPRNCASSSSSESVNTQSLPEVRGARPLPESRSSNFNQTNSPSPGATSKDFSLDLLSPTFESRTSLSSSSSSPSCAVLSSQSRETLVSPVLNNRSFSPDTQASSPFQELRGRVSLPDLFSRGSTPDIEDSPHTPEFISDPDKTGRDTTTTPENQDTRLPAEPSSTVSTPAPRYTPPSPVISFVPSPELRESSVSPEFKHTAPSPDLLSAASPAKTGTRTPGPSPKTRHISTLSETSIQVSSPVVNQSLSPSPEIRSNSSPRENRNTASSPEIRITESSPEVSRREQASEVETISDSPLLDPHLESASSRRITSSPHITGISYTVVQPEDRDTSPFPELYHLSTPEPDRTRVSPQERSPTPSRDSAQSSIAESSGTPRDSPHISGFTSSVLQPETLSHQPRYQTPSPRLEHHAPSPEPRYQTPSSGKYQSPSPQHRSRDPSPVAPSPEQRYQQHSPPTLPTEYNPQYLQPTPPPLNTPLSENSSQLSTKLGRKNKDRFTEDMAHHVNRRRTPSPPLTRFTPVHIIAPEKPYRQWQNRGRSPPQVVASSQSGNLKKVVTNRESPNVAPADNNSLAPWVRQGKQLEMERAMQLEEDRKIGRERQRDGEMEREKKREERVPEKGEGWQGDASYRGEQVELSFNARNRKGPASRSTAPTSRETRQGLPTVHSYSESLLANRQLQQQQSLLRLASQQDTRGGGPSRRLQPPALQNKNSARVVANRLCQSSSSSMGSEFDDADNEVKWFTDLAFSSLSSPEVDYLDMYNSSHRSSTNISQPSTQESPAGVNAAWLAYADLRGSAPKLDNDELSFQQPSTHYSDGLDPSRRYEMGSFECVDVAVEREESTRVRRGVPKRQIQLKRKNNAEGKQDESSDNSSPGIPVMVDSPSLESHSRETLLRQHSTPAAMQECCPSEHSLEANQQNERKSKLQKSASLDETKTKMATCLIKSVLSKKMQSVDKQPDEQVGEEVSPTFEENSLPIENAVEPLKESPKPNAHNLSSPLYSDYSLSSDCHAMRGEQSPKEEARSSKSFAVKSNNRPSSSSSSSRSVNFSRTDSEEADSQDRNATLLRSEIKSELKVPFDSKLSRTGVQRAGESKTWEEMVDGDSANTTAGNTGAPSDTGVRSTQVRMTDRNRNQECENTVDHKKLQQGDESPYMSKTQEISFKAVEKKKASLNVCLTPEAENKLEASSPNMSFRQKEERVETNVDLKTEEEDGNGNSKVKVPIHKVRDVRRLVKNTYNLSFKATSSERKEDIKEEMRDEVIEEEQREIRQEETRQEVIEEEEVEVRQEVRREECLDERKEEFIVERKEEQKVEMKDEKPLTLSLQSKAKSPSRLQPMQIEYKAVCWKEDKSKVIPSSKDSENPDDKQQPSPKLIMKASREQENYSDTKTQNSTTGDATIIKPCQQNLNVEGKTQETKTETYKVPHSEDKPLVVRTDRKPPMLGSLPKLPSKEREVSTAVVLIRDASSKSKTSVSPAQEEVPTSPQAPATSPSPGPMTPGSTSGSSGHTVSMLLKEKGYQADIGAVVGDGQNAAGGKGAPRKHVNSLEIPLQTTMPSDGGWIESHRDRTFSTSSTMSGRSAVSDHTDTLTKTREEEGASVKPTVKDAAKQKSASPQRTTQDQAPLPIKQKEQGDFEAVKRLDPTFPPRSPAIRRLRPQPIEVKSLSKETEKQEILTNNTGTNRPQTIEVKSIAKNSQKPVVPPKPSCKFKPSDLGGMPNEAQRPTVTTSAAKPQSEERSQTIVVSSPTIYRKISNESTSTSNYTRKLAVSAVSSLKPPPSKTTATTISSLSNQSTVPPDTEASNDRGQQQQPGASTQTSRYTQRPTTLATTPKLALVPGLNSAPAPVSDPTANQVPGPALAGARQASQSAVVDPNSQPQYSRTAYPHEQAMPVTSNNPKPPAAVSITQAPGYTHQPYRSLSSERSQRTDDLRFYASDDPPSYDERESFSPLMLPDLNPRRSNRYQPSSRLPPCSCTAGCPSHPGLPPSHHHRSPHNVTPPAPPHSPGQALPYPVTQPALRPHQCRPDPQPMSFQPSSPKSSPLSSGQAPAMYQPLHQPPPCPPHPSLMQSCPADRPMQPAQHIDPRRPSAHRSPQQQPLGIAGAPYSDPGHSHSPGLPSMDPQYLCGPQTLGPSYGSEYGGDSSSLYSESGYGQTPRRVLLDPETGKYFYIEVPMQPLRKMLFDPETGQYVEVLIPQQAMSHSGLYPPSAAPYPSLHNPSMYATGPQYMPYAAPPPTAHPQTQPQPPRYPEASAAATMHPNGPGVSYRNSSGQGSKPELQNHPPLDQSYLESMYYVPTGMNASPNPTPPDYYHKHPPNLPPTGGKRS
ncbi:serine/arginine repetitive matrix protein 2 [Scomber scombrus]|uniref:serine/arginine repetitive matrix protein 2 n=1 Tax=Scomber scombrus TaxID=13677 RepID=UPI002DDBB338|nr:serine/arginine repetitive matrix protein 2 [Scomber scombrus]